MDQRGLLIKPGAHVDFYKWKDGAYVVENVTEDTPYHLMESTWLEEGVTLRDIFTIYERHKELYSVILNNWLEEFIEEARMPKNQNEEETSIEYLILHWHIDAQNKGKYPQAPQALMPRFSGWGKCDEAIEGQTEGYWGVDFCPVNTIIDLPLKLDHKLFMNLNGTSMWFQEAEFTLLEILYGIIWELSFFGRPNKRRETLQHLIDTRDEIGIPLPERLNSKSE